MTKQKRYTSEEQIIAQIDRAKSLEQQDIEQVCNHRKEIARLRPFESEAHTMNHHKYQVEILEKRIKGREGRLQKMKEKLAEFRTLTFPVMNDLVGDGSIAR